MNSWVGSCIYLFGLHYLKIQSPDIGRAHRHYVGLVTGIVPGLGYQGLQVIFLDAMLAQPGVQSERGKESGDEVDRGVVGLPVSCLHDIEAAGGADPAVNARLARCAELHAGNQAESIGEAVVQSANGGERMRQRMDNPEILLKRHRAHCGSDEHLAASIQVTPVPEGSGKGVNDEMDTLERDAVAHRMKCRAGVTLDAMGQSVSPGRRGEFWRQVPRQD